MKADAALLERVRADGLLVPGRPVVVLVSSGRDSTCLLDVAVRVGAEVSALHVNYGLRDAAEVDERHCRELCERLGVELEVHRERRPARGNVQAWAREVRYRLAAEREGDVATGHTRTDQLETILYRLASSPSRRALYGMPSRAGRVVRPLLEVTRAQTAAYCRERGLEWREDESNAERAYARARIRHELVPALLAVHPAAERNVLALAEILRDEGAVLDQLVEDVLAEPLTVSRLRALPEALGRLVVQRLADAAAGGPAPGAARRAEEIARMSERGSARLDIGHGLRAVAEYGALHIERIGGGGRAPLPVELPIPGRVRFGEREVVCEVGPPAPGPGVLDRGLLGPRLLVRGWRTGDRMAPLGLGGTKSLQDLFTARRVPRAQRASIPVVESEGEIAWVAGVATSERFKVTGGTTDAVRLLARGPDVVDA